MKLRGSFSRNLNRLTAREGWRQAKKSLFRRCGASIPREATRATERTRGQLAIQLHIDRSDVGQCGFIKKIMRVRTKMPILGNIIDRNTQIVQPFAFRVYRFEDANAVEKLFFIDGRAVHEAM